MYIALCQLHSYMSSLLSFFFMCDAVYLFYDAFFYFKPLFLDVRFRKLNFTLQLQLFITSTFPTASLTSPVLVSLVLSILYCIKQNVLPANQDKNTSNDS